MSIVYFEYYGYSICFLNKSPQKKNPNKKIQTSEYSINDVKINIIKKSEVQATINTVAEVYAQQTAHTLKVHQVKIAQGTHIK